MKKILIPAVVGMHCAVITALFIVQGCQPVKETTAATVILKQHLDARPTSHPHLLFDAAEATRIRARLTNEPYADAWAAGEKATAVCRDRTSIFWNFLDNMILGNESKRQAWLQARGFLERAEGKKPEGRAGWKKDSELEALVCDRFAWPLFHLAFRWQIGHAAEDERLLREILPALARDPRAGLSTKGENPFLYDALMACIYDWTWELMTAEAQAGFRRYFLGRVNVYLGALRRAFYLHRGTFRGCNGVPTHAAGALPLLAIYGEPGYRSEWGDALLQIFADFFKDGMDPEGAHLDSVAYFSYGMRFPAPETMAALTRKGANLFSIPSAGNAADWFCYEKMPFVNAPNNFGDCQLGWGSSGFFEALRAYGPARSSVDYVVRHISAGSPWQILLWRTPLPESVRLGDGLPDVAYYPFRNEVIYKSDWTEDALMFAFESPWRISHKHAECNHFTLYGCGNGWAGDSGYAHAAANAHNLVLIDGRSQSGPPGGDIIQFGNGQMVGFVQGDATAAYCTKFVGYQGKPVQPNLPVARAYRYGLWTKPGLTPPYVLIVDDIQKDPDQPSLYAWQFNTRSGNCLRRDGRRVTAFCHPRESYISVPYNNATNVSFRINVPASGEYFLFVFGGQLSSWLGMSVDGKSISQGALTNPNWGQIGPFWAWTAWKPVKLAEGPREMKITIRATGADANVAAFLFVPIPPDKKGEDMPLPQTYDYEKLSRLGVFVPITREMAGAGWRSVRSQCEFIFLRPSSGLEYVENWYDHKAYQREQHARFAMQTRTNAPLFTVLLYPHWSDQPLPEIKPANVQGYQQMIAWPNTVAGTGVVDYVNVIDDLGGGTSGHSFVPNGKIAWVRTVTNQPKQIVSFALVSGRSLRFGRTWLVQTEAQPPDFPASPEGTNPPILNFDRLVSVTAAPEEVRAWGVIPPEMLLKVELPLQVRVYGPTVARVYVEDIETAFRRDGDYVVFTVTPRRRENDLQRLEQEVELELLGRRW